MTDRPFRCNSCYKCFSEEAALREHIPKHNETKHLKTKICPVCGKSYAQETYLSRHMLRHQAASATDGVSTAVRPNLSPVSVYISQPVSASVVPAPVYKASVGSCYPQLPSAMSQHSAMEPVGFHAHFLRNQYTSNDQLN